jgi:hypothetical protein
MDTKSKGDLAEQAAVLQALKRGWGVLRPVGDRLAYDLVFDVDGSLVKIQVKYAWFDKRTDNYVVDNRRTKTNRRNMVRDVYSDTDFEFALAFVEDLDVFYVFPIDVFISYGSGIHLVEADRRQRKPQSADFRDAWNLISQWAADGETHLRSPVKFGEAAGGVIPSQAPKNSEKV